MSRETELPDGTLVLRWPKRASIAVNGRFVYCFAWGPIELDVALAVAAGWSGAKIMQVVALFEELNARGWEAK